MQSRIFTNGADFWSTDRAAEASDACNLLYLLMNGLKNHAAYEYLTQIVGWTSYRYSRAIGFLLKNRLWRVDA